jgi:sec-independent protein translocase protein TatA
MFGLGGTELAILLIILLLVFGPSQIPKMARGLGQAMKEFRKGHREVADELRDETSKPAPPKPPENEPIQ